MKKLLVALCALGSSLAFAADTLESEEDKVGYSFGWVLGKRMQNDVPGLAIEPFIEAFKKSYSGEPGLLTDGEVSQILSEFQRDLQQRQIEQVRIMGEENRAKGDAFLAENKNKEGVVTLASGLQYKVMTEGSGQQPSATDRVTVHYTGSLISGEVFDSSVERGAPATFGLNQVIPGWTEGLQLMPVGSKWQLFIPSDLAYGPNGNRGIGPNETLIFEVELLGIEEG